jgi:cell division septum initiation protein DivIVA
MSVQQHSATTALLATPSVQAAATGQHFDTAQRGYHKAQVDEWVHWALTEIETLTQRAASFAGHELGSPAGQKLIAELVQIAADEITGQQAAAAAEIEQMIAGARQQAESIIADARKQADQTIATATQQANTLVSSARADAKKTTDDAAVHAAAVNEAAGARMAQLARLHEDGLNRIAQIHQVTGQAMDAEKARGPLSAEVEKALAAIRR